MATVTFEQGRECVISKVTALRPRLPIEEIALVDSAGRVLAEDVVADRDYPPFARSMRDGFAVRAEDLPGEFLIVGEVRAGDLFSREVAPGQAVEIMTGAPVPSGADSVVMVEHCRVEGDKVITDRVLKRGDNVTPRGSEIVAGHVALAAGHRLGSAEIAALATVGAHHVRVYRRPQVAIIATGDEIVEITERPLDYQIRNSNTAMLCAQVARAGGNPVALPIARDVYDSTRELVERGLEFDVLLLCGGVSAGKYDMVERVLADLGAEFYFDRVLIQPGQPLVFGRARDKFFFGLPGNPGSSMVTFELFARAAVELLSGQHEVALPLMAAKLAADFHAKPGLTRFLPAVLSADGSRVTPIRWSGSGDVTALARANAFVVTEPDRESWSAGDWIRVLQK